MITDGKPYPRVRGKKGKKRKMGTPTLPSQASPRATQALTAREDEMERQARRMRTQGLRAMKKKR